MSLQKYRMTSLRDKHDALTNAELAGEIQKLKEETMKKTKTVESKKRKKNKKYE